MLNTLLAPFKVDKEQQALTQTEHKLITEKDVNLFTTKFKTANMNMDSNAILECWAEASNNKYTVKINSCGMCYSFRNGALVSISQI